MDLGGLIQSIDWDFLESTLTRVLAVLLCLTVHETCHGLAAYALGDPTARDRHRLSLNPFRHIDWLGLAMMLAAGFGWAKPVPVDPRYFKKPKRGMALTALAGPVSNLLLAFLAMLFCHKVLADWIVFDTCPAYWLYVFLHLWAAPLSIGLGLFNLLPIPPLDGSKVLAAFLPDRTYFGLMRYERYGMAVLLLLVWLNIGGSYLSEAMYRVYLWMARLFF